MARRIAVVLLLVLALAQGSALACALHCAAMHRRHAQPSRDACCAGLQSTMDSASPSVMLRTDRAIWSHSRASAAPLRSLCAGDALAAPWRTARPTAQQSVRVAVDAAPAPLAFRPVARLTARPQSRKPRIPSVRPIPLRI